MLLKISGDRKRQLYSWCNKKALPVEEELNYLFSGFNPNIAHQYRYIPTARILVFPGRINRQRKEMDPRNGEKNYVLLAEAKVEIRIFTYNTFKKNIPQTSSKVIKINGQVSFKWHNLR